MSKEIDDRLDELADLAACWASRRALDMPVTKVRGFLIRACEDISHKVAGASDRVPRAWLRGQPYED